MSDSSRREGLRFRVRSRLMTMIGLELISSDIVALTELVKNSFDADARFVAIRLTGDVDENGEIKAGTGALQILDDGHGMDDLTIVDTWLEPATGFRKRSTKTPRGRRVLGEKGVGRFAAAKLGSHLNLVSKRMGSDEVQIAVDWSAFEDENKYLDDIELELNTSPTGLFDPSGPIAVAWQDWAEGYLDAGPRPTDGQGTLLTVTRLRSAWTRELANDVMKSLSRLVSPFDDASEIANDFNIILDLPDRFGISGLVERPDVLQYPHYRLIADVGESGEATVLIDLRSGEQRDFKYALAMPDERDRLRSGPFEVRLNVWDRDMESLRALAGEADSTKSVRSILDAAAGISVYRDGFRVLPFGEPDDDWLRLDARRVQNPTQRLSNNQIVGYVLIGRDTNPELTDQTNREGLLESPALDDLRQAVRELLALLEAERYKIRPRRERRKRGGLLERIDLSELQSAVEAAVPKDSPVLDKVAEVQQHVDERIDRIGEVLARYHRLATLGQLVDRVVHELTQPILAIRQAAVLGTESLNDVNEESEEEGDHTARGKMYRYFDTIKTQVGVANAVVQRIVPFGGRRRGRPQQYKIEDAIGDALALMGEDIRSAGVEVDLPDTVHQVTLDSTEIQQVLVNLLSNSLHWLKRVRPSLRFIAIDVEKNADGALSLIVEDSGPGIPEDDRDYIFDPYFSTKEDGVGLGLTIAGEIVSDYYGGELELLSPGSLGGARFRATFRRRIE